MALQPSLQKLQVFLQLEENEAEIDLGIAQLLQHRRRRRRRARRRFRVRPWILRRTDFGHYDRLKQELEAEDQESFTNFLRIPPEMLRELEERLSPRLLKQDTWFREALKPGLKLRLSFDGLGVLLLWLFLTCLSAGERTSSWLDSPSECSSGVNSRGGVSLLLTPDFLF